MYFCLHNTKYGSHQTKKKQKVEQFFCIISRNIRKNWRILHQVCSLLVIFIAQVLSKWRGPNYHLYIRKSSIFFSLQRVYDTQMDSFRKGKTLEKSFKKMFLSNLIIFACQNATTRSFFSLKMHFCGAIKYICNGFSIYYRPKVTITHAKYLAHTDN